MDNNSKMGYNRRCETYPSADAEQTQKNTYIISTDNKHGKNA